MLKSVPRSTILAIFVFLLGIALMTFYVFSEHNIYDIGYLIILVIYFCRYVWVKLHED